MFCCVVGGCFVILVWAFLIAYLNCFFELNIVLSNQVTVNNYAFWSEAVLVPPQKYWIQLRGSNKDPKAIKIELHRNFYFKLKYSCWCSYTDSAVLSSSFALSVLAKKGLRTPVTGDIHFSSCFSFQGTCSGLMLAEHQALTKPTLSLPTAPGQGERKYNKRDNDWKRSLTKYCHRQNRLKLDILI